MKLLALLALGCCSSIVVLSEGAGSTEQALQERASAQLERLAPYRKASQVQGTSNEQWQLLENVAKKSGIEKLSGQQAFEIYRLLPEDMQVNIANKVGGNRAMIELLANPKYMELMQERIKRSGSKREVYSQDGYEAPPDGYPHEEYEGYPPESYGEHHGGGYPQSSGSDSGSILKGSGSLIGGIAKGIIGGLVSASSSASKGSSSISASSSQSSAQSSSSSSDYKKKPEYGQVYSYGDQAFDVWDFKKAIISTLMQAVKAISGGVIALKGQLLKGSGYLVSTKGKIITKTGDAVTALGRNIAKSAVYRHSESPHPNYLYDHPPAGGHEDTYEGPPPSAGDYAEANEGYHGNSHYESSSDVDDQAGLLIAKPTKPDDHDHSSPNLDAQKPALTQPEEIGYHGPPPVLPSKDIKNTVTGNANDYQNFHQDNHHDLHSNQPPPSSYDVPIHLNLLNDHTKGHDYPIYPPLAPHSPLNLQNPISIQQSVEYPPIHLQYVLPDKENLDLPNGDIANNDLSVYSSLSIDMEPDIGTIKVSPLKHEDGHELPKLQPLENFHGVLPLPNSYPLLHEPLKIPLLNSHSTPYWPNQELLQPFGNFNAHGFYRRRSSAPRRRSVSEMAKRRRLHRG
ncbi:uncharacterized protein LOC143425145 isoform X2 [Xylocopa sonorina]|uniref:uncharacterized protein LOC143425145 isoform X2 n=1 Tax=Xylocopa sonorina TaxID=1818115 RepID=UPI00403ABA47